MLWGAWWCRGEGPSWCAGRCVAAWSTDWPESLWSATRSHPLDRPWREGSRELAKRSPIRLLRLLQLPKATHCRPNGSLESFDQGGNRRRTLHDVQPQYDGDADHLQCPDRNRQRQRQAEERGEQHAAPNQGQGGIPDR